MAQAAGLHNAWARYGTNVDRDLWARLVRITHWTADDVAREDRIRIEVGEVSPESTVDSFAEVLGEFQFVTPDIVTLGRDAIR
jgi:phosphoglycolate phosphatase